MSPLSLVSLAPNVKPATNHRLRNGLVVVTACFVGACAFGAGSARVQPPLAQQPVPPPIDKRQPPARVDFHGDPLPHEALARLGTVRLRHVSDIRALAFAADGKSVIVSGGRAIRRWDVATGKDISTFPLLSDGGFLAPDGKTLAIRGSANKVLLIDAASGRERGRLDANNTFIRDLAFSSDSKYLATVGFGGICLWDVAAAAVVRQIDKRTSAERVLFSPDGKVLAAQEKDAVLLYETATGNLLPRPKKGHQSLHAQSLAFSPDSKFLACIDHGVIHLWDLALGKEALQFQPANVKDPSFAFSLTFAPDGKTLASAGNGKVSFWETATGKELRQFSNQRWSTKALAISPDGTLLALGGQDKTVRILDAATGKDQHALQGHQGICYTVTFAPHGQSVATTDFASVHLWDVATGKGLRQFAGEADSHYAPSLGFSRDGKTLAYKSWLGPLRLWQLSTGKAMAQQQLSPISQPPAMAFSPDGQVLAIPALQQTTNPIELWDTATGKKLRQFAGDGAGITSMKFSPNGKVLAHGSQASRIILVDAVTGQELRRLTHPGTGVIYPIAFAPDGRTLLSNAAGDRYRLWDTATGKELPFAIEKPLGYDVAISPDGNFLASWGWVNDGEDHDVHLWELVTGQEVRRFRGHTANVKCVAFSPDGRKLVSGSNDLTALVWDVTGQILAGPPAPLTAKELEGLWADLASSDAAPAYRAVGKLANGHEAVVRFLDKRIQPTPLRDAEHLAQLVARLDDANFGVREKASRELEALQEQATSALQAALANRPTLEMRLRIERILKDGPVTSPAKLQQLRAIIVLERIGSTKARELLTRQAGGDPAALVTMRAKAAQERLSKATVLAPGK